ncbi:MoaD/ThiS family protein [Halorarum halophilum]|uniref:MoaD/ThiS family protein n=1 Tax=Halorarum halophilum TaxID=2743090 RepID=A0A7D5K1B6_9EURY|nr:MoaD/ThiS family protein [Halobaculum halophilum]
MQLTLKFFATFREAVGSKFAEREVPEGATVGDVLTELEAEYEGLAGELIEDGDLRPQINVLLDGREVLHMEGIDTTLSDGDTLAIFPPVAGGADCTNAGSDEPTADRDGSNTGSAERVESYRGISRRLAVRYLRNLGGETDRPDEEATTVTGDGWRAELSAEKVKAGGSLTLTEVTVRFSGDAAALEDLVPAFDQKAMRAGG